MIDATELNRVVTIVKTQFFNATTVDFKSLTNEDWKNIMRESVKNLDDQLKPVYKSRVIGRLEEPISVVITVVILLSDDTEFCRIDYTITPTSTTVGDVVSNPEL